MHRISLDNIQRSPLYGGMIEGVGPRYCPSIEDKVVRFAGKDRHPIFVEPCGENTEEMYLQGASSSCLLYTSYSPFSWVTTPFTWPSSTSMEMISA